MPSTRVPFSTTSDRFRFALLAGTGAVLGGSGLLAAAGASMGLCLLMLVLAPAVTVVGYETLRHRQTADARQQL